MHSGKTNYESLNAAPASTHNQLPGFGYDIAGNMVSNGTATYTYDAENRLISTAGYAYTYDGKGERVKKASGSTGTLYWKGMGSDPNRGKQSLRHDAWKSRSFWRCWAPPTWAAMFIRHILADGSWLSVAFHVSG